MNVIDPAITAVESEQDKHLPMERVRLRIGGMTCAGCASRVHRALDDLPAVVTSSVNLATGQAYADVKAGQLTPAAVAKAVSVAGYEAEVLQADTTIDLDKPKAWRQTAFLVAAIFLTAPLIAQMILSWLGFDWKLSHGVQFALATPVQFIMGWRFYRAAYHALKARAGNMDQLVVLGTSAAYGYSLYLTLFTNSTHLYVEASATVITLVLLGKWLEERAKRSAGSAIRALVAETPETANLIIDGVETTVPLSQLVMGDHVTVRPGERIPVDGRVMSGESDNDESLITGESRLISKQAGDPVTAGAINVGGFLTIETLAVGTETVLARIIRLVDGAQSAQAPIQKLVDRIAAVFVPIVILIALATFAIWYLLTGMAIDALLPAVAVLVIACPCALGLATPAAIMVGTGVAARHGILIRDPEALERCREVDIVVMDKTGTLTMGKPQVTGVEGDILQIAASALQPSEHPLAKAIIVMAKKQGLELSSVADFQNQPGRGIQATVSGRSILVGNANFVGASAKSTSGTEVYVAADKQVLGHIKLSDQVRPTAEKAVSVLRQLGIETVMLSGDNESAAKQIADQIGIDRVEAGVAPAGKAAFIAKLKAEGHIVAMVGDGVNDAPALAVADVSIAMGSGSDVAMETAAITLMRSDPLMVADAIDISRATSRRVRQNLFWAFAYNVVAIPVAAAGLLSPALAGAAMALSSVSVVANALLLRNWRATLSNAGEL